MKRVLGLQAVPDVGANALAKRQIQVAVHLAGRPDTDERQIDPGDPVEGDVAKRELPSLPADWTSSIDAFESGPIMAELFHPALRSALVSCKRQEANRFLDKVSELEIETYLETV